MTTAALSTALATIQPAFIDRQVGEGVPKDRYERELFMNTPRPEVPGYGGYAAVGPRRLTTASASEAEAASAGSTIIGSGSGAVGADAFRVRGQLSRRRAGQHAERRWWSRV